MTGRVLRIGHRGAAGHAPENTVAAIEAGISLGVDYVEIDVQRTADGRLVVMHDKRVDRTTSGTGLISEMSLDAIRALDAGNGQRVPLLAEVLAAVNGRTGLMAEIITPGLAGEMVAAVRQSGFWSPLLYASFLHRELLHVRVHDSGARTLALLEGAPVSGPQFALDARASHAGLALDSVTPEFVASLQQAGISVFVYTANDPRDIARARKIGVDGIISDYPDRV